MDRLAFRNDVFERLTWRFGNRDDCRVFYENGPNVDMNTSTLPVISMEISYIDSVQAEFSGDPLIKDVGEILLTVLVKESSGNLKALELREELTTLFQRQNLSGATLSVAKLLPNSKLVKGWVGYRTVIPFWHYHH
nr:MAG TPA: hypothetical protein [Caudoviricetes sp.]